METEMTALTAVAAMAIFIIGLKKRFRIIYLTARALEIVRRLAALNPDGKVFRTRSGTPFTSWSVNCRMCRLQEGEPVRLAS